MSIHQEDIIINIGIPNNRAPKTRSKTNRIEGRNDNSTTVGVFNTSLSKMNGTTRQINKEMKDLNDIINH